MEYPEYICYKANVESDSNTNTNTTLIDWDTVMKLLSHNVSVNKRVAALIIEHNKTVKNDLVIVMSRNITNTFTRLRRLHESSIVLQKEFGKYFKSCVILHEDGYYRFPFDGFKTVCKTLEIKSINTFITATNVVHYDSYVKGCHNYDIRDLYTLQGSNTIMQYTHQKMQFPKIRFSSIDIFEKTITVINSLKRHLILLVGPPHIGKTTLAERLKGRKMRYIRTRICNKKVRYNVSIYLDEKEDDDDENLIIDGEHATEAERFMFIKACQVKNVSCVCVLFDATKQECCYMNSYLFNMCKGECVKKHTNGMSRFYSKYQKPRLCEGINDIMHIHGIPCVENNDKMF